MVYTVSVRNLSFKMNLNNLELMLSNQQATYAIMKYSQDVPESVFFSAIKLLTSSIEDIYHRRLKEVVNKYKKSIITAGIIMSDELVGSVIVEDGIATYYEEDKAVWSKNVKPNIEMDLEDDDD